MKQSSLPYHLFKIFNSLSCSVNALFHKLSCTSFPMANSILPKFKLYFSFKVVIKISTSIIFQLLFCDFFNCCLPKASLFSLYFIHRSIYFIWLRTSTFNWSCKSHAMYFFCILKNFRGQGTQKTDITKKVENRKVCHFIFEILTTSNISFIKKLD